MRINYKKRGLQVVIPSFKKRSSAPEMMLEVALYGISDCSVLCCEGGGSVVMSLADLAWCLIHRFSRVRFVSTQASRTRTV